MKRFFGAIALTLIPALSHASSYSGAQLVEAKAVLQSQEIQTLLAVEKKAHNLKCEKMTADDVSIKADADMDAFEVVYGCNDKNGGANVQRIHFSGGVYTGSPTSRTAQVIVTGMQVELSE